MKPANDTLPSGADPDGDIIPRIARGDQRAFSLLVDRHVKTLTALATHMLGDPHMAEDVTQAVFLKTWTMMPEWVPGQAKLITWMRRVTTNLCLDHLRKKQPIYSGNIPDQVSEDDSPFDRLATDETARDMLQAITTLPDRQKAALTLSYYQDVSQKEAAHILDLSVSAYDSLLRRARQSLKNYYTAKNLSLKSGGT